MFEIYFKHKVSPKLASNLVMHVVLNGLGYSVVNYYSLHYHEQILCRTYSSGGN